jgi:hypothetical protein
MAIQLSEVSRWTVGHKLAAVFAGFALLVTGLIIFMPNSVEAQVANPGRYNIGTPDTNELWVHPVNGNDNNDGMTPNTPLRTLGAAWNKIPANQTLTKGYRIKLQPGNYEAGTYPNYLSDRIGTYQFPIIIEATSTFGVIFKGKLGLSDVNYVYLIDLNVIPTTISGGNVVHCASCQNVLFRGLTINGNGTGNRGAREGLKVNQSKNIWVEDSNISGASGNSVDYVAVQYGHILYNKIHNAGDWCMYTKGGSAYLTIEGNELYNCTVGGYVAGRSTGFEFMVSPWLHYEAYDTKFVNNVIHDVDGPGMGVRGGYNILLAYNTLYKVGKNRPVIEVAFGGRTCDGDATKCGQNLAAGGWGHTAVGDTFELEDQIPNRNVFIYNNLIYNPAGFPVGTRHFNIPAADNANSPHTGTNIPNPALADQNLRIRGNLIWNGPANHPLGVGGIYGCANTNPTCNAAQLASDNTINTLEPELENPNSGDFQPKPDGNVLGVPTYALLNFPGGDRFLPPLAPEGILTHNVARDRFSCSRPQPTSTVGAFLQGCSFALAATATGTNSIALTWQDPYRGEGLFDLQRSTSVTFTNPLTTRLTYGTTAYTDTNGLSLGTTYYYRIRACQGLVTEICSAYTGVVSATTAVLSGTITNPAPVPPTANSVFTLTVTVQDTSGATLDYDGLISLELVNNPTGAFFYGNLNQYAQNGVATFPNLSISKAGNGYTVAARAENFIFARLQFNVETANSCDGLLVNSSAGDSASDTFPASCTTITLSGALNRAQPGDIIRFDREVLGSNTVTINLSGVTALPNLPQRATLDGGPCTLGRVILDGGGITGNGLKLSGSNFIRNLWVKNSGGVNIRTLGVANVMQCVTTSRN